jgi:hypothetical protein
VVKLFVFAITLVPLFAEAQSFYAIRRNRNLLVSFGSGTANYHGEMVNPGEFGILKPNVAVGAEYYFTTRISTRVELTWFQLSGDDSKANDDRSQRNLSFTSSCLELSAVGVINLSPVGLRFYQRSQVNFHAFLGIGVLRFNPKARVPPTDRNGNPLPDAGDKVSLQPLETEGIKYARIQPVIPIGLGARIKINPFLNVLVEGGYRITFTDYLDDVSIRRYPDRATLKSELSKVMTDRRLEIGKDPSNPLTGKRGNPDKNDGYFIANITLQYYLPKEIFQNSQRKLYNTKRKAWMRKSRRR